MFARPSLAESPSAMVQAAPRRLDALCGKSAEEIRGYRQSGLRVRRRGRTVECAARRGPVLDRPGGEDFSGRQSPYKAVSVLGMADPSGSTSPSRWDLPGGGVHAAEADERPCQTRLYPILHLFHLAHATLGTGAISDLADPLARARLLSAELLRQHARYPALSFAERRELDVQVPRRTGRDTVDQLRHV